MNSSKSIKQDSSIEHFRNLIENEISNIEKMDLLIYQMSEVIQTSKPLLKKEIIRSFSLISSIFKDSLVIFAPKITSILINRLGEPLLHDCISESLGSLVNDIFQNGVKQEMVNCLHEIFLLITSSINTPNPTLQVGASASLAKIIQNSPIDLLNELLPELCNKLLEFVESDIFSKPIILEALISLILAVEVNFSKYVEQFIEPMRKCIESPVWKTRKNAIDILYIFASILPNSLKNSILILKVILEKVKHDQVGEVKLAAEEALFKINELTQHSNIDATRNENPQIHINTKENKILILDQNSQSKNDQNDNNTNKKNQNLSVKDFKNPKNYEQKEVKIANENFVNKRIIHQKEEKQIILNSQNDLNCSECRMKIQEKGQEINLFMKNFNEYQKNTRNELYLIKNRINHLNKLIINLTNHSDISIKKEAKQQNIITNNNENKMEENLNFTQIKLNKIQLLLKENKIDEAFEEALVSKDNILIIKLITKVSNWQNDVDQNLLTKIYEKLFQIASENEFLELILCNLLKALKKGTEDLTFKSRLTALIQKILSEETCSKLFNRGLITQIEKLLETISNSN